MTNTNDIKQQIRQVLADSVAASLKDAKIAYSKKLFELGAISARDHEEQLLEACYSRTAQNITENPESMTYKRFQDALRKIEPTSGQITLKTELDLDRKIMINAARFLQNTR